MPKAMELDEKYVSSPSETHDYRPNNPAQQYASVGLPGSQDNSGTEWAYCDSTDTDLEAGRVCPPFRVWPASSTTEHFRDIDSLGPFTLHRFFVLLWLGGVVTGLHFLQNVFWLPTRDIDWTWMWLGFIWLIPLPGAVAFALGALWFRYDTKLDEVKGVPHQVVFRIVSRGVNKQCLRNTIQTCRQRMKLDPLFPYLIEVVTDGDTFEAPREPDVLHLRVPESYQPAGGALFKARALHYACKRSLVPKNTWVVHLDEESHPTSSCIKGIAKMIGECEDKFQINRIGQGMILYHRGWKKHPFLTLADMRRTGDDLGHFHLQHRIGYPIFGLHGSYVVCRHDVEEKLGFDVGPRGSITEDAWWILQAAQNGYRTKWIEGYMEEQSTESMSDFIKQRRRWYVGLFKVGIFCPVKLYHRMLVMYNTISWMILPFLVPMQIAYTVMSFIWNKQIFLPIRVLSNFVFAVALLVYYSGLTINMREHGTPWWRVPIWFVLQTVGLPFFFLLEVMGIFSAFLSPFSEKAKGFHVVEKDGIASLRRKSSEFSSEESSTT